ncbi:MAG: FAD-dependent oxidoreductase [Anaerolineales bacterium]|nr:FAD-dependent oxidoreductase [Anaerolineales bacterium]
MSSPTIAIIGAGVYGVTAALALQARGYAVTVFDPGPLPHPGAASTDISKVLRPDYGPDEVYTAWMEQAFEGWQRWQAAWPDPLVHLTGVFYPARTPLQPGDYEYESYQVLARRGHRPERLDAAAIAARFPAWAAAGFVDGYYNPLGGYAESGRVMGQLLRQAEAAGVRFVTERAVVRVHEQGSRAAGVVLDDGQVHTAGQVVVAAGAWTPHLLPELAGALRSTGLPVFHLRPARPELFQAERFPVFGADVTVTGYYGFPLHREGVVKIAHHGAGRSLSPADPARGVTEAEIAHLRVFLRGYLPELAEAPLAFTRQCFYCDTWDGHLWIAPDPARPGLVVAAGDSGHAFKFAPVVGDVIADAVEGRPNPLLALFRWRPEVRGGGGQEASRQQA